MSDPSKFSILRRSTAFIVLLAIACMGCCPAWRLGAPKIQIAAQEVLVYWDAANGMEHFVRRADFDADKLPDDFGFLVPTPTQPSLTETPDEVFQRLGEAIKPKIVYRKRYVPDLTPLLLYPFASRYGMIAVDSAMAPNSVAVLDTVFVGGFEASVLRATDVDALVAWLEENGYDARDELRDWLTPYIDKQWIVTAFKFDCVPGEERSLSRKAVCMSFATDKPFFPYRVPTDQLVAPENGSLLRVYFAGEQRQTAALEGDSSSWSATTRFSAPVANAATVLAGLGGEDNPVELPDTAWLTTFEDKTWPGGTEDLYFSAHSDQSEVRPPPIVRKRTTTVPIPLDVILGIGLVIFFVRRRRKKAAADADLV